jgi:protease-4
MQDKLFDQHVTVDLVHELLKDKRKERRWKNIRFFMGFLLIVFFVVLFSAESDKTVALNGKSRGYVALLRLEGIIEPGQNFSSEEVVPLLRDAFADTKAKGVVIDINSGGGTPVQASIIHDAIVELKKKYHKKVIVVGEDMLASGAYYVAVGADKIYVNPNTVTGSIGVIMKGFGFTDLIKKVGVERRVYTAGENKDRLDPFLPQSPADIEKVKSVIDEIHQNFNQVVLEGRKGKLHGDTAQLFSGDFWSGSKALELGLVDGLGNLSDVLDKEFHVSHYKIYGHGSGLLKSIMGQVATSVVLALHNDKVKLLEEI